MFAVGTGSVAITIVGCPYQFHGEQCNQQTDLAVLPVLLCVQGHWPKASQPHKP